MSDDAKKGGYKAIRENPAENPNNEISEEQKEKEFGFVEAEAGKESLIGEKKDVKGESLKGRSEVGRDVLKSEVSAGDKETESEINKLQNKLPETKEEKEAFESLEIVVSAGILIDEFKKMKSQADLVKIKNFEYVKGLNPDNFKNSADKAAIKKLQEIAKNPKSPFCKKLSAEWPKIVDKSYKNYQTANYVKQKMENKEPEGFTDKAKKYGEKAYETVKAHPVLCLVGAAAGAYGLYRFFKWMKSDKKGAKTSGEKESGAGLWKWTKRLLWASGITFALGRISGLESVQRWAEKIGIEKAAKFLNLISHGKFKEAWELVYEGFENEKLYDKMVANIELEKKVKVSKLTLAKISIQKYGDFMQEGIVSGNLDKLKESAKDWVADTSPFATKFLNFSPDELKDIKIIREYLKNHEEELKAKNVTSDTPLLAVYSLITGQPIELPRNIKDMPEFKPVVEGINSIKDHAKKESINQKLTIAFYGSEGYASWISEEDAKEILKELAKKHNVSEAINLFKKRTQTLQELGLLVRNEAIPEEDINKKIQELTEYNNELADHLIKKYGLDHIRYLCVARGIPLAWTYFKQPYLYKEYIKYVHKEVFKAPGEFVDKLGSKLELKNYDEIVKNTDTEIKKLEQELSGVKDKIRLAGGEVKTSEILGADGRPMQREVVNEAKVPKDLLDRKKSLERLIEEQNLTKGLAEKEKKLDQLMQEFKEKKAGLKNVAADSGEIRKLEKSIVDLKDEVKGLKVNVEAKRAVINVDNFEIKSKAELKVKNAKPIEKVVNADFKAEQFKELKQIESRINQNAQKLVSGMESNFNALEKLKPGSLAATKLVEETNDFISSYAKLGLVPKETIEHIVSKFGINNLSPSVIAELKNWHIEVIAHLHQKSATGKLTEKILGKISFTTLRGKLIYCIPRIGLLAAGTAIGSRPGVSKLATGGQMALDMIPFVGDASMIRSALWGEEIVTGAKLDTVDRLVSGIVGVSGLVINTVSFGAGGTILKGGLKIGGKLFGIGKNSEKFMKGLGRYEKWQKLESVQKVGKAAGTTQKIVIGGVLGMMGYNLFFNTEEKEMPPEFKQIMGDSLQEVSVSSGNPEAKIEPNKT